MENTSSELFKVFLIKYFNISYSSSSVRGWTALISYTAWNSSPYCTLLKNLSCEMKHLFFYQCSDTHATWLKVEYIYYSIYIELKFQNKIYWDFFNSAAACLPAFYKKKKEEEEKKEEEDTFMRVYSSIPFGRILAYLCSPVSPLGGYLFNYILQYPLWEDTCLTCLT